MTDRQQHKTTSRADKGLGRMIVLSVGLHLGVIAALIMAGVHTPSGLQPLQAVSVSLIDPSTLGEGMPPGSGKGGAPKPGGQEKPAPPPPPQIQTPPPEKESPAEKAEPPPPPKPEPKKEVVKIPDQEKPKEAKKNTAKKREQPKPELKTVEPKPKPKEPVEKPKAEQPKPELKTVKPKPKPKEPVEKPKAEPPDEKKQTTQSRPTPKEPRRKVSDPQRDEQRLAAAIERIRQKVRDTPASSQRGSSGQGTSGEGGGGGVPGLAFLMYTEQVKQRVKENWIVTQKNAGLTAVVEFSVRPDGEIVAVTLAQSSGNSAFDQSVLRAVYRANPLPSPPPQYQQEFLSQKVKVAFGK